MEGRGLGVQREDEVETKVFWEHPKKPLNRGGSRIFCLGFRGVARSISAVFNRVVYSDPVWIRT